MSQMEGDTNYAEDQDKNNRDEDQIFDPEANPEQDEEEEDDEQRGIPESMRELLKSKLNDAFGQDDDQAIEDDGEKRRPKKQRGQLKEEDKLKILYKAQKFVDKMENAYTEDRNSFENGKAATSKLMMMKEVESQMRNKPFADACRAFKIMKVFAKWIEPGPQGNLPSHRIRSGIYRILKTFPIRKETIKEGEMGQLLLKLWRHPKETAENRTILHQIIEEWLRYVTGMGSNYQEISNEGMDEGAASKADYISTINRSRERGFTNEQEDRSVFAMLPKPNLRVYVKDAPNVEKKPLTVSTGSADAMVRKWAREHNK